MKVSSNNSVVSFCSTLFISLCIVLLSAFYPAMAQEGARQAPPATISVATTNATPQVQACEKKSAIVLLDVTGSFVDHLLNKDLFKNSVNRIRSDFPKLCIGSEVKLAIIGHSHRDVSGSYDHLESKNYTISRNYYTAENISSTVVKQLEVWRDKLANGQMRPQNNTAVAMAFDNVAELVNLNGKPAVIWAITDGDETELGGVAAPIKPNQLAGSTVYMFGAGVTLTSGTIGQRKLRSEWEGYFKQAGTEKFFWVSKP